MAAIETSRHDGARHGQAAPGPLADVFRRLHALYARRRAVGQQIDRTYGRGLALREQSLALIEAASRAQARSLAVCGSRGLLLERSAYARLVARLQTMPVIEQAKGILMAQSGCSADQAFDLLRRASQRTNVPVRELAPKIIEHARQESAEYPQAS